MLIRMVKDRPNPPFDWPTFDRELHKVVADLLLDNDLLQKATTTHENANVFCDKLSTQFHK